MRGRRERRCGLFVAAVVVAAGPAHAGDEIVDALQVKVDALEAEIAALRAGRAARDGAWLDEARSDAVRGLVADVLADADTRAAFTQGATTGGYRDGFVLTSADGDYLLRVNGLMQTRFLVNRIDAPAGVDGSRAGFDVKRVTLRLSGNLHGPDLLYEVELKHEVDGTLVTDTSLLAADAAAAYGRLGYRDVSSADPATEVRLRQAWIGRRLGRWTVRGGQFQSAYLRENAMAFFDDQPVESSLVNNIYGVDVIQGIEAAYAADLWRVTASINDGAGTANTPSVALGTEYAVMARVEAILLGTWEQQVDLSSPPDGEVGLMIGGGVIYQRGESGTTASELDQIGWTVDASLELGGPNVLVAVIGRRLDEGDGGFHANQLGLVLQGGWDLGAWQPFVRYEWSDLDTPGLTDVSIVTAGVRWDLAGHIRWTTDVMYGFDPVPVGSALVGVRPDSGESGQVVLRTQLGVRF